MSSVIVAGARTPVGRYLGTFSTMTAVQLGGIAIAAALERARVNPDDVDHTESMSLAPHLLQRSRTGLAYGSATMIDALEYDGLQ
jgi:acetyl-CoA acetyltransferase